MTVELDEVRAFLADHEPFAHLPAETLGGLPQHMGITYVRRGQTVINYGDVNDTLYIIRSGAIDVVGPDNALLDRRDAGRTFGYSTLVDDPRSRYMMAAVEDSVLYMLPRTPFRALVDAFPETLRYFDTASRRIKAAADELKEDSAASDVLRTPVGELVAGARLITVDGAATIAEGARLMDEHAISSLIVTGATEPGIVTDRDFRSRVVAKGVDTQAPLREVMTSPVRTIASDALVFEAMLVMGELGTHHLPVTDGGEIIGVATSSDIMRQLKSDPIYVAADVKKSSRAQLAGAYERGAVVAARFFDRGASAFESQRLLTGVADSIARRLYALAVAELGEPPVPFAFVAVGSQARGEMGPASDQDNALVLDDSFDAALHGDYFARLGDYICSGLAEAGQALCPGGIMAHNPQWRMTESQWNDTFHGWVTAPEPDALLNAQVFFDFRCIFSAFGGEQMAQRVHDNAVVAARGSKRLHAHLAALATWREPPIGFFRGFVVERSGEYADTLDVKKGGTAAVVQMARLYAITAGVGEVDTLARIRASAGSSVSVKGAEDLLGAYEYLTDLALKQQTRQLRRGERPNYHIDPKALPSRERDALRDAFGVIKNLQSALGNKYPVRSV